MNARNPGDTRARIAAAARTEFAAHGPEGARVDSIARAAQANKERLYGHYGSKSALFEYVVTESISSWLRDVPFTADDLAGYAGALFDHFDAHPEHLRLIQWGQLASPRVHGMDESATALIHARANEVRDQQYAGRISTHWAPEDLFAVIFELATGWFVVPEVHPDSAGAPSERARRRSILESTVARLIAPGPRDPGIAHAAPVD
jgi:AcrR family transcriptional regulator